MRLSLQTRNVKHFPFGNLGYAFASVTIFTLIYLGAYYASIERVTVRPGGTFNWGGIHIAGHRFGGDVSKTIFRPAHEPDRRYRRFYWNHLAD